MSEEEGEIYLLSHKELDKVEYTTVKQFCCVNGCNGYKKVRDYGISPIFYDRNSGANGFRCDWQDLTMLHFFCRKHHQYYKDNREEVADTEYCINKLEPA